jgi:SPP1 gp7 family putative phage head morphogenesis protein
MVNTLVNTDKAAATIIQGNSIKAYGDNMNYGTYEIEHDSKINTGFTLYDENTVKNLLKEDPKIIPMPKVDIPKDELWNRQHLTSAVTQGILQGESIPKIADRLQNVAFMGRNSAIRNARTYTTAAENKGRIDSYERAEKLGIQTNKKWIATLDDRTRAEHRHLDGMSVSPDEDFKVDGYTISFPGDPSAEPEMFYNCRCTLVADIVGYPYNDERKDDKLGDMSYEEWKHAKDKESKEEAKEEPVKEEPKELKIDKLEKVMKEKDYQEFYELVDNAENRKLYEMYGEVGTYSYKSGGGRYTHGSDAIEFSYEKSREGIDKYSTLAHEFNHKADAHIGRNDNLHYSEIDLINDRTRGPYKIDTIKPYASTSDEFLTALRTDMEDLKVLYNSKPDEKHEYESGKMYTYFAGKTKLGEVLFTSENAYNASSGIQDAIDGFFGGQGTIFGWGHGDRYYDRVYNGSIKGLNKEKDLKSALNELGFDASNQAKVKRITRQYEAASEAWANVGSAVTTQSEELEMWEKYMPNTVKAYKSIVEVL